MKCTIVCVCVFYTFIIKFNLKQQVFVSTQKKGNIRH